jgi:hypothetical protein
MLIPRFDDFEADGIHEVGEMGLCEIAGIGDARERKDEKEVGPGGWEELLADETEHAPCDMSM